jgi:transposase InsO family protein
MESKNRSENIRIHKAKWDEKQIEKMSSAILRQKQASERTPMEQIARLDKRNGVGARAKRERAKLEKAMRDAFINNSVK